jgi:phosphoribosylformylglycinamidine synthase
VDLRISVITFPGSNCDHDAHAVFQSRGHDSRLVWHKDHDLQDPDLVVLPGGFSYGDYLRCGALARFSPIVKEVVDFAAKGGLVLGICNGFQILTECGLLPGTLMMNSGLSFVCKHQYIKVENSNSPFTKSILSGTVLDVPIAHKEGNYFIDTDGLKELEDRSQVLFRYSDASGATIPEANPNGSTANIAGICNPQRNVLGMMPHPERAATDHVSSKDGRGIFVSLESHFSARR